MSASNHYSIRLTVLAVLVAACCLLLPAAAGADTYIVDNVAAGNVGDCTSLPAGDCTLRDAIDAANTNTGPDTIDFTLPLSIVLDDPLPAVTDPVAIDGFGANVSVSGSVGYDCTGSDYAFDLTAPSASPSSVRAVPIFAVCNRAINSNVAPPTIRVGPRRFDNTVSVNGQAAPGATVDVFASDDPGVGTQEADTWLATPAAASGAFAFIPGSEPVAGTRFTATQITGGAGSNFAARAETPADLTSPTLVRAVAVSNSAVRLDFSEPIAPGSAPAGAFSLAVASIPRAIAGTTVSGYSVFVESSLPWQTGEAGDVALSGTVRVADVQGNEVLGQPGIGVFAGPGELNLPQVTSMRLAPNRFCKKATRRCRKASTVVLIALNKPARVIFEVRRGGRRGKTMVTFIRRLDAGRNRVKLSPIVSGKQLPATILVLRATAQDVARSLSTPVDAVFRVVTDKSKL